MALEIQVLAWDKHHLSPQTIKHTQKRPQHMHGIGNPCSGLGQTQICGRVKLINVIPTIPS